MVKCKKWLKEQSIIYKKWKRNKQFHYDIVQEENWFQKSNQHLKRNLNKKEKEGIKNWDPGQFGNQERTF